MKFYTIIENNLKKDLKKIIFIDYKKKWTCEEVIEYTDKFAKIIRPNINKKQISVPILLSRRVELLIAFLACLKLNISFTPVLKLSESEVFIIAKKINSNFYFDPIKKEVIVNNKIKINYKKTQKIKNKVYILFTSGSTGKPKGVICDKQNIINTLLWSKNYLNWKKNDVIGNITKFNFDISLFDFFTSIYFSVPIYILKNTYNINSIFKDINKNKITSFFSTPSFFSQFVYGNSVQKTKKTSLKQIISGGDFFPNSHLKLWIKNNEKIKIFNVWGPTETSIVNSMHLIDSKDKKNINNYKYMSVGVSTKRMEIKLIKRKKIISENYTHGDICLSGKSICKGFIDENQRYKKMLIRINKKTYFNTGDIGYFDKNECLFIVGRKDNDIKIQGYRMNQKEIERISETYNNVFLSASFKRIINEEFSELHLLIQLTKFKEFDIFDFKTFLRNKLDFYKVPKKIILIKKIPLNSNGKIDRIKINKIYA